MPLSTDTVYAFSRPLRPLCPSSSSPKDSSDFCRCIWRSLICPFSRALELWSSHICLFRAEAGGTDLTARNARAEACQDTKQHCRLTKERKQKTRKARGLALTSASVTLSGSSAPEGTKSHDLARCSTRADFAERSAVKKPTASADLFTDASPIGRGTAPWLLGRPPIKKAPVPSQRPLR
ncbi:hypothetical protein Cgig2_000362 [Carnegiea gigantea]|uniref:Uncharacterized protein n=1 Tax=Carnegiea gigantea TaxID=171969 RepID=A0A9Q1QC78_9CARY|nr:hypothetical protein Cgig2_000362 [Carnegiea gigantea]